MSSSDSSSSSSFNPFGVSLASLTDAQTAFSTLQYSPSQYKPAVPKKSPPSPPSVAPAFIPFDAATMTLQFDPKSVAASPRTLRLAQLWPQDDDSVTQQYLTAVIELVASVPAASAFSLTPPAAVALANCGARLAGYLLGRALESEQGIDANKMGVTREAALKFRGGFAPTPSASPPPLPLPIMERWWRVAKEEQICGRFLNQLDKDIERYVCAFIVAQAIKRTVEAACVSAAECHSKLLTIGLLEYSAPCTAVNLFARVGGVVCPEIVPLKSSQSFIEGIEVGKKSVLHSGFWQGTNTNTLEAENIAIQRVLNADCWYHDPPLVRRVAEQFARGERCQSELERTLFEMGIRPMRVVERDDVLSPYLAQRAFSNGQPNPPNWISRLHLLVKDATGHEFAMLLDFGTFRNPSVWEPNSITLASLKLPGDRNLVLRVSSVSKGHWSFQPLLSPQQKQAEAQLEQAAAQVRAAIAQLESAAKAINRVGSESMPNMQTISFHSPTSSLPAPSHHFENLSVQFATNQAPVKVAPVTAMQDVSPLLQHVQEQWRDFGFEKVIRLSHPLLDFKRWGSSRYEDFQPADVRRQFQSCLIDAVMQANNMQLLPTDLLNLIADYSTCDSLPYITLEEQQQLSISFEAELLTAFSTSI